MVMQSVVMAQLFGGSGTGGSGSTASTILSLVPFALIFVIFYFLVILPQQKRAKQQKALLEALKKGDKVVTASGIWGTVTNLGKGDGDVADRGYDEDSDTTGSDSPITWW